jgi:hypothetical protein
MWPPWNDVHIHEPWWKNWCIERTLEKKGVKKL